MSQDNKILILLILKNLVNPVHTSLINLHAQDLLLFALR